MAVLEAARGELALQLGRQQELLKARDAELAALRAENERLKATVAATAGGAKVRRWGGTVPPVDGHASCCGLQQRGCGWRLGGTIKREDKLVARL